ncbi:MAG TPA: glycerophosphatase, partial [Amycolatopsis sp.]|nr:glycerophosphatase [Amycolatopsis sp.]
MSQQLIRAFRRVGHTDRALMRRSAALPATRADDALATLSRSANKSRLWWAIALVLAARKGRTRRGALRGVAAIGFASALANLIAK